MTVRVRSGRRKTASGATGSIAKTNSFGRFCFGHSPCCVTWNRGKTGDGAEGGDRTHTALTGHGILSPECLPVPPPRHRPHQGPPTATVWYRYATGDRHRSAKSRPTSRRDVRARRSLASRDKTADRIERTGPTRERLKPPVAPGRGSDPRRGGSAAAIDGQRPGEQPPDTDQRQREINDPADEGQVDGDEDGEQADQQG